MSVSSIGIGSGLDVSSIISQLVTLEKAPLTSLQTKQEAIQTRISTYAQVKSMVTTLNDAVSKLTRDSGWNGMTVSSTSSAVSGTVTGIASASSFTFGVSQLARAQSVASASAASDATVGAGTLSIQLGTWSGSGDAFTAGSAAAIDVTVSATDTLTDVAAKINEANAGVTATILKDASGDRLMLRSKDTGEAAGFRIQVDAAGQSSGLSQLAFDPENAPGAGMAAQTVQYGQNTQATINGIAVTSTNNVFADVIPGIKLTATQVTTEDAEVTIAADTAAMKKNIQDFVDAYNSLNELLSTSTKYDSETKTAGILQGDSTAVGLQNALRMLTMGTASNAGAFQRLADIGIEMQSGGSLKLTESKLNTALENPNALKSLFAATASGNGSGGGIAVNFKSFTSGLLALDGTLDTKADALDRQLDSNADAQAKVNARASTLETRLKAQYTALDTKMASLTALSTYIEQQVAAWNKTSK